MMAIKIVPEQRIFICDCCLKTIHPSSKRRDAKLVMHAHGLDYQGMAVGPGGWKYDLCDECCTAVEVAVQKTINERKPKGQS